LDLGNYPRHAAFSLSALILFLLGFIVFWTWETAIISLVAIILFTVFASYKNKTPLGGFFLGAFASLCFFLGNTLFICVSELGFSISQGHPATGQILAYVLLALKLPSLISAVAAIASIGLFFGLLGYVFEHISLRVTVTHPRLFRDYWSNIHFLGKSDKREQSSLDRRLSSWSIRKKNWWKELTSKITELQPDLIFSQQKAKADLGFSRGDLFDLASGRMIGQNLVSPLDLASKFKPMVLKLAETSANPKGVRRLALERLLANFLERFIFSRLIWAVHLFLSISLFASVYLVYREKILEGSFWISGDELIAVAFAAMLCAITFLFVWEWQKSSKELFEKRPDERPLVFLVHLVLALLYAFYFQAIVNPPWFYSSEWTYDIPKQWISCFTLWTEWFLLSSFLIGIGYIFIHRECELVNTYYYDNSPTESGVSRASPFKEPQDEPFWLKEEKTRAYWVMRFMYFWHYEITTVPHADWERVEVWVDAENGTPKWVVSDYHYRELWYSIEKEIPALYVKFFINFHTPVPITDPAETEAISNMLNQKNLSLIKTSFTGKTLKPLETLRLKKTEFWTQLHPPNWIIPYGLPNIAAKFLSQLPWTYWRYPHGLERAENYMRQPATTSEEQPKPKQK